MNSVITDAVQKDIEEFKNKGLEKIYPFIFIDGIRFKTREDGYSKEVSVYIVLGINLEGRKEVIGFYIGEYETSKMLLNVLNNIKTRGCEQIFVISCDNYQEFQMLLKQNIQIQIFKNVLFIKIEITLNLLITKN